MDKAVKHSTPLPKTDRKEASQVETKELPKVVRPHEIVRRASPLTRYFE
jgi:hypothetical protein